MSLDAFLHPVKELEVREITVSSRFKNPDGSLATIKLRALNQLENEALLRRAMIKDKVNGVIQERLDSMKYHDLLVLNSIVEPNFQDPDFCAKVGVPTPADAIKKIFNAVEYAKIVQTINEMSDYVTEAYEEAKN